MASRWTPPSPGPAAQEALLWAACAGVWWVLAGHPTGTGPDSQELLATARALNGGPLPPDPLRWPPLWTAAVAGLGRVVDLEAGARALNHVAAAGVAAPLYLGARALGGVWAARGVTALWVVHPGVGAHAALLEPRPLLWFLSAWALSLAVRAGLGATLWRRALFVAALAPLVRPEGLALPVLVGLGAVLAGAREWVWRAPLALGPALAWSLAGGGQRGVWERFYAPWAGTVPQADFLALTGGAGAPSALRALLLRAVEQGVERPPSALPALIGGLPGGLAELGAALVGTLGVLGLGAAAVGAAGLVGAGPRPALAVLGLLLPLGVLAALPMSFQQASPATNLLFWVPALLGLAARGLRGLGPGGMGFVLLAALEQAWSPLRPPAPVFVEDGEAAWAMAAFLRAHPGGPVATGLSGRAVVYRAGLWPEPLPSPWQAWDPPVGQRALVGSADLGGEDGGRGLSLLQDPAWAALHHTRDPSGLFVLLERQAAGEAPPAQAPPAQAPPSATQR